MAATFSINIRCVAIHLATIFLFAAAIVLAG